MTDIAERLRKIAIAGATGEAAAEIERLRDDTHMLWDAVAEKNAEIERLRKRERRLAARVKQLHDIIQADRGPDFYIPAPDEPTA